MYQLIELNHGRVIVLSSGTYFKMMTLKKTMLGKAHGALIIKPVGDSKCWN